MHSVTEIKTTFANGINPWGFYKPAKSQMDDEDAGAVLRYIQMHRRCSALEIADALEFTTQLVQKVCLKLAHSGHVRSGFRSAVGKTTVVYEATESEQALSAAIIDAVKKKPGIPAKELHEVCGVHLYDKLHRMTKQNILRRERIGGVYHYWSVE